MADQRVLRGRSATLKATLYDQDGVATDGAGAVTVAVTRADGTVVKAAGTATTNPAGSGTYAVALSAAEVGSNVGQLTAVWTDAGGGSQTTIVDVVGGYYVSVDQVKALPNLSAKTTDQVVDARRWFEDLTERYCHQAFVPRYARRTISGSGSAAVLLPDWPVRSILTVRDYTTATTYSSFDATALTDLRIAADGTVSRVSGRSWTYGTDNVLVEYEHGLASPPQDIREAALIAIRATLLNDATGRPMLSVADGAGGTTRYSTAGIDRPTGIPDVDEVLNAHRLPVLA